MKHLLSISGLEFKKIIQKKEFLVGLIAVLVMGCGMVYGAYTYPDSFGLHNVNAFYGNFASILILFLAAKTLGEEFDLKTATFLFTSRSSRTEIYTAKVIGVTASCMIIGLCGGILHDVAVILCKQDWTTGSLLWNITTEMLAYALYGFVAGATAILLTTIRNTTIIPFIYLIILYWVLPNVLQMVLVRFDAWKHVVGCVAFYFADEFLMYQIWSVKNVVILLINGLFFYFASLAVVAKKDLC